MIGCRYICQHVAGDDKVTWACKQVELSSVPCTVLLTIGALEQQSAPLSHVSPDIYC